VLGLFRTFFSEYRSIRAHLGLEHYTPEEMLAVFSRIGLSGERMARNLGHNQARMSFAGTSA